jgi:hypothetical protein
MMDNLFNAKRSESKIMSSWKSLLRVLLSSRSDPEFKIAQVVETLDGGLLFDLRQYSKGKSTKNGISLPVAEAKWLKNHLQSDKVKYSLEHGNRTLKFEKTPSSLTLHVIRSDKSERMVVLNKDEEKCLMENLNNLMEKMLKRAIELGCETDFNEFEYVKEN